MNFYTGDVGNPEVPHKLRTAIVAQGQVQPPSAALVPARDRAIIQAPVQALAPRRKTVVWVAAGGGGILAAVLIAFGATQILHFRSASQDKDPQVLAAPASSGTSTTSSAPASADTTSAGAPSGSAAPSQTTSPAPAPSQAAPASAPKKPAQAGQAPSQPQDGREEAALQEQRERLIMMAGRAAALHGSLDNLQRQQNAAGLGLRGDMAAARESMDYLLDEAKAALRAHDADGTKRNLDLAEKQVEKLERFLGR